MSVEVITNDSGVKSDDFSTEDDGMESERSLPIAEAPVDVQRVREMSVEV